MKGQWEKRIGMLLNPDINPDFVYSYKPPDGLHGGQTKIDWHACDIAGRYWLIEVKQAREGALSINLLNDVSPGQRDGLTAVAYSECGIALLAVGQGSRLYFFDWRQCRWLLEHNVSKLLFLDSFLIFEWTGPKGWTNNNLYELVAEKLPSLAPTPRLLGKP